MGRLRQRALAPGHYLRAVCSRILCRRADSAPSGRWHFFHLLDRARTRFISGPNRKIVATVDLFRFHDSLSEGSSQPASEHLAYRSSRSLFSFDSLGNCRRRPDRRASLGRFLFSAGSMVQAIRY